MASNNKYDRQLRLWGAQGQKNLSKSHILLLNPQSTAGTETLKNLILPGCGGFSICGEEDVTDGDNESENGDNEGSKNPKPPPDNKSEIHKTNFFYPPTPKSSTHTSYTEGCKNYLSELNPDVSSSFSLCSAYTQHFTTPSSLINPSTKKQYTLIILPDLPSSLCIKISKLTDSPLLVLNSYGLTGTVRIYSKHAHNVVESRLENDAFDLRLSSGMVLPGLQKIADGVDLGGLASMEHSHVPYPVILLKASEQYKLLNPSSPVPVTFADKAKFKDLIKSMAKCYNDEINFEEAVREAFKVWTRKVLPDNVKALLDAIDPANPDNSNFGILLRALKEFTVLSSVGGGEGLVGCLNPTIPDMHSSTEGYIQIQNVYFEKGKVDLDRFTAIVKSIEGGGDVGDDEILTFTRNCYQLNSTAYRSLVDEYTFTGSAYEQVKEQLIEQYTDYVDNLDVDSLSEQGEDMVAPPPPPLLWYYGLRACNAFLEEHGMYPGSIDVKLDSDVITLHKVYSDILVKAGLTSALVDDANATVKSFDWIDKICHELTRYNAADVHNTASVLGGIGGQEAVKVITKQYVPVRNTVVFDGVSCTSEVYEF